MSNTTGSSSTTSLTTSIATVTVTSSTSTSSSIITISTTSTSSTSLTPSTTIVTPSTTSAISTSTSAPVTSVVITETPSSTGGTLPPQVVTITSTQSPPPTIPSTTSSSTSQSSTPTPSTLSATSSSSSSKGLSSGGKIAIAVIIPVAVIAAAFFFGLLFWRRRKARKSEEELRKNEMAEYGFNPNHDPSLVPVGAAYAENGSDAHEDNSGYRGWGATSSNRKLSTTHGSQSRAQGAGYSDSGSQPGGNTQGSDHYSPDPMLTSHPEGNDGIGALGATAAGGVAAAGVAGRHRNSNTDIRRGTSNASSAYSNGRAQSEASSDVPAMPGGNYYQEEVPYNIYNDAQPHHGPYGDGSYGGTGGEPIIRDVQARRNTRIERAPTFPQTQGGIAQNF